MKIGSFIFKFLGKIRIIWILAFLAIQMVSAVSLAYPVKQSVPNRDSGVFLYIGQEILENKIPYRDIWDHKGPVIYYIDALGLLILHGSAWGVWGVEVLFLFTTALVLYKVFRVFWDRITALLALSVFSIFLGNLLLDGNNLTEEYSLLFQALSLLLFINYLHRCKNVYLFMMGVFGAMLFLLKPNLIGTTAAISFFILIRNNSGSLYKQIPSKLLFIGSGFFLPISGWGIYIAAENGAVDFFNAFIRYNLVYSNNGVNRIQAIEKGIIQFSPILFFTILLLSLFFIGSHFIIDKNKQEDFKIQLVMLSFIWLLIEMVLSGISGWSYSHYYIPWLIPFSFLVGFVIMQFRNLARRLLPIQFNWVNTTINIVFASIILGSVGLASYIVWKNLIPSQTQLFVDTPPELAYITKLPDDQPIILWGAETGYLFVSHRISPTRFVYQYPLCDPAYVTNAMTDEFADDLQVYKPLIIDTSFNNPNVSPIDNNEPYLPITNPNLNSLLLYITIPSPKISQ